MERCNLCGLQIELLTLYDQGRTCIDWRCPLMSHEARMDRALQLGDLADHLAEREACKFEREACRVRFRRHA